MERPFDWLASLPGRWRSVGQSTQHERATGNFNPLSIDVTPWGPRYQLPRDHSQALVGPEGIGINLLQDAVKASGALADQLRSRYRLNPISFDWMIPLEQSIVVNDAKMLAGTEGSSIWAEFRAVLDSVATPVVPPKDPPPPPPPPPTGTLSSPGQRVDELWAWVNQQWPTVRPLAIALLELLRKALSRK